MTVLVILQAMFLFVMAKLFESMKEATGVDLAEIMKADTYDAKVDPEY